MRGVATANYNEDGNNFKREAVHASNTSGDAINQS